MSEDEQLLAAGADGCKIGWVVALGYGSTDTISRIELVVEPSATTLMDRMRGHRDQPSLAVDIPIGLPGRTEGRGCDREARKLLGRRHMCVFNPPDRELLQCGSFKQVQDLVAKRKETDPQAKGLPKQGFYIGAKIRDFDEAIRNIGPYPQWLIEVHPEVSFRLLAKKDLSSKKKAAGKKERRAFLQGAFPGLQISRVVDGLDYPKNRVAEDDRLDACVALWSAFRLVRKEHRVLGGDNDEFGIPMRIVA